MYKKIRAVLIAQNGYAPTNKEIRIIECDRMGNWIVFSVGKFVYTWDGRKLDKYYERVRLNHLGDIPEEDKSYIVYYNNGFMGYIDV